MKHVRITYVIPVHSTSGDVTTFLHLKDIYCHGDVHVDILIGQDHPHLLRPFDVRTSRDDEPLGWTLNGPVTSQPNKRMVTSNCIFSTNIEKKPYQLLQFNSVRDVSAYSHNDLRELESWDKECRVVSDQLHIPIPWKDSCVRWLC